MNTRTVFRVTLALAATAALAAACGVANPFSPAAASTSQLDQLVRWARCMRQHGVNVPDPVRGPAFGKPVPGRTPPPPSGPVVSDPQFETARNACKQYLPNGDPMGSGPPSQSQIDQETRFAQCMRDHGIPLQDPTVQGSGTGGPGIDPNSSQFQQAQKACAKYSETGGSG
jgi:hypothetical protein